MILNTREILEIKELPKYNEGLTIVSAPKESTTHPYDYTTIITHMKKSPEAIGILNALTTDIVSDGYHFEPIIEKNIKKTDGVQAQNKGKERVRAAEEFAEENFFKEEHASSVFDWLMLGNGALWTGRPEKPDAASKEEILNKIVSAVIEVKEQKANTPDEHVYSAKKIRSLAWSTMHIHLNKTKTDVAYYTQKVGESTITFSPDEIIHSKFMNFDGKAYGFSPLIASMNVVSTLSLIKDYSGYFFQNGGIPDWMFILPKEMAGSPNAKRLEQTLKKYKNEKNKHGNLVFTGEVTTEQMNKFDKDMEFRQLAIYYAGVLAFAFGMPMSRIASIIGSEIRQSGGTDDLADAGYWRNISRSQDYWESLLNSQLFIPDFKVRIKFNRSYKQDEVRETQIMIQKIDVVKNMKQMNIVTDEWAYKYMGIHEKDRSEGKIEAEPKLPDIRGTEAQLPNKKVLPGEQGQSFAKKKADEQKPK